MQSLQDALFQLPNAVVQVIESFVGLRSLGPWRAVNRQALEDVELRARAVLLQLNFVRPILVDLGALKLPTPGNSYWFQVMKCTYACRQCHEHQSYTQIQSFAVAQKLCTSCLDVSQEFVVCDVCFMLHKPWTCNKCHECQFLACDDCSDEALGMCLGCTELFCQHCIRDDYCNFCQD